MSQTYQSRLARVVSDPKRSALILSGRMRRVAASYVMNAAASTLIPIVLRTSIYRVCGARISSSARVFGGVFARSHHLRLGPRVTINVNCVIDNWAPVTVGARTGIGVGVQLLTSSHEMEDPRVRAGKSTFGEISIGEGVWVGSGAIILPGITIGDGAVVAAGAVVTRDVDPHTLVGGVPARVLRNLQ